MGYDDCARTATTVTKTTEKQKRILLMLARRKSDAVITFPLKEISDLGLLHANEVMMYIQLK